MPSFSPAVFPAVVNLQNRLPLGLLLLLWIIVAYVVPNQFQLTSPVPVPLTPVDRSIPLSPFFWTWIYISYYPYLISVFFFVRDEENLNQYFYSLFVSAAVAAMIFFAYPTSIPRELYPLNEITGVPDGILNFLRSIDASVNCAPSMHVTMTTIAGLTAHRESRRLGPAAAAWAVLIFYSTMATKQHYFIDVMGGLVFGVVTFAVFSRARYAQTLPFKLFQQR